MNQKIADYSTNAINRLKRDIDSITDPGQKRLAISVTNALARLMDAVPDATADLDLEVSDGLRIVADCLRRTAEFVADLSALTKEHEDERRLQQTVPGKDSAPDAETGGKSTDEDDPAQQVGPGAPEV